MQTFVQIGLREQDFQNIVYKHTLGFCAILSMYIYIRKLAWDIFVSNSNISVFFLAIELNFKHGLYNGMNV